jgi:hypothetical protein
MIYKNNVCTKHLKPVQIHSYIHITRASVIIHVSFFFYKPQSRIFVNSVFYVL